MTKRFYAWVRVCLSIAVFAHSTVGWAGEAALSLASPHAVSRSTPPPSCAIFFSDSASAATTDSWTATEWLAAADSLRALLAHKSLLSCISTTRAFDLLSYSADRTAAESLYRSLDRDIDQAKEHWFNFEFHEALALTNHALDLIDAAAKSPTSEQQAFIPLGEKKAHALLVKALILKAMGKKSEVKQCFAAAIALSPHLTIDVLEFPPSYRALFDKIKTAQASDTRGAVHIASSPPGASVYLNGIKYGETPLTVEALPSGPYTLTLTATHYHTHKEEISVSPQQTLSIMATLPWQKSTISHGPIDKNSPLFLSGRIDAALSPSPSQSADLRTLALLKEALAKGNTLHADKIIVLSGSRASPAATMEIRLLDRALAASHRPIAVPVADLYAHHRFNWEPFAGELAKLIGEPLLANPGKTLDPRTGDLIVLSHRKTPLYRRPLFWAGVGTAIVGGIVGGILATQGGNSDAPAAAAGSGGVGVGLDGF